MSEVGQVSEDRVGEGRSAVVYLGHDCEGRPLARKVFTGDTASKLVRFELKQDEAGSYLADFSVHIVIKPVVKTIQWGVLPALWISGVIPELTFGLLLVTGGSIARTIYTFGRMLHALTVHQRLPWMALMVGMLPVVGNAAYPLQLRCRRAYAGKIDD